MEKRTVLLLIASIVSLFSFSQNDKRAKEVLDRVYTYYLNSSGIQARFSLTITEVNGETFLQQGKADIKGNKYAVTTDEFEAWFDGTTQWVYVKETEEVNVTTPTAESIVMMSPTGFLSLYRQGYNIVKAKSVKEQGRELLIISLKSKDKNKEFSSYDIVIDEKKNLVLSVDLIAKGGMRSTVSIVTDKVNCNLDDSLFVFSDKKFPDAEIIDLR